MVLLFATILAVAAVTTYVALRLARRRYRHLCNMERLHQRFFAAAAALAEDRQTPPVVIDALDLMARQLDRPAFGYRLLAAAVAGDLRDAVERPRAQTTAVLRALQAMDGEQRRTAEAAFASFALAASFNNLLLGSVNRRLILFWINGLDCVSPLVVAMIRLR